MPKLDAVIAAVEAGNRQALIELLLFDKEACAPPIQGLGGPPVCAETEPEGTLVDVLPMASCEGYWVRPEDIGQALTPLFDGPVPARLYAAYRADARVFDRSGEYVLLFEQTGLPDGPRASAAVMTEAGVIGINLGCGHNAEQFVEFHKLSDAIVEPPEMRTQ